MGQESFRKDISPNTFQSILVKKNKKLRKGEDYENWEIFRKRQLILSKRIINTIIERKKKKKTCSENERWC